MSLNQLLVTTNDLPFPPRKPWCSISVEDLYISGNIYSNNKTHITWNNIVKILNGVTTNLPILPNGLLFDFVQGGYTMMVSVLCIIKQENGNSSNVYDLQKTIEISNTNVWVKDGPTLKKSILLDYIDPSQITIDFVTNTILSNTEQLSITNNSGSNQIVSYNVSINVGQNFI